MRGPGDAVASFNTILMVQSLINRNGHWLSGDELAVDSKFEAEHNSFARCSRLKTAFFEVLNLFGHSHWLNVGQCRRF